MTIFRLMPKSVGLYSVPIKSRLPSLVCSVRTANYARISSLWSEMSDSHHFVRQKREPLISPFEPSSPVGELFSMILQQERHFFQLAVEAQLQELTLERDRATDACKKPNSASPEFSLHERIEEMKERERQVAVEDIMYLSVVYKFSEVDIPMIPKLLPCITSSVIQVNKSKIRELESIHSLEVQEMITEHMREKHDETSTTKLERLHLGQSYASSVMYGYFLKCACCRRESEHGTNASVREKLRNYVGGLDSKSFKRCAKIQSKQAVNVIERHTWALFGENIGRVDGDEEVVVTYHTMKRIMLEAVNFGYFLRDVECSVDSIYGLMRY